MMTDRELETKFIEELLDITNTVLMVYKKLQYYEANENMIEYQEWFDNLKMCMEVEDKIYEKGFSKLSVLELDRIIRRITYLNNRRKLDPEQKGLIIDRIISYLDTKEQLNPFLSQQEDVVLRNEENAIRITVQYNLDYVCKLIDLCNRKIKDSDNLDLKKGFISFKYQVIFMNKIVEFGLLDNSFINLEITGRERAIAFHQDEELVESIYQEANLFQFNIVLNDLLSCFDKQDILVVDEATVLIQLINLECVVAFFTKEQIEEIVIGLSRKASLKNYSIMKEVYSIRPVRYDFCLNLRYMLSL